MVVVVVMEATEAATGAMAVATEAMVVAAMVDMVAAMAVDMVADMVAAMVVMEVMDVKVNTYNMDRQICIKSYYYIKDFTYTYI